MRKFHKAKKLQHQGFNPIRAAYAVKAQNDNILNLRVMCALNQDGDVFIEQLANMAYVIALGAEIAVHLDKQSPAARSLHGALRSILQMVQDGGRWCRAFSLPVSDALEQSNALCKAHPDLGLSFNPGAIELSDAIRTGRADMSAIAGAEIYLEQI